MDMPTKVFLDLEDTIISTWDDATLRNVNVINSWLDSFHVRPTTVQIHSFAIWDEKDKAHFVDSKMKAMIEQALNVTITEWLSVEDMQKIVQDWSNLRFESRLDFMQLHGKHDSFIKVCLAREEQCRCILVDDAVPNRTVIDHTRGLTIDLLPVQVLQRQPIRNVQHKL